MCNCSYSLSESFMRILYMVDKGFCDELCDVFVRILVVMKCNLPKFHTLQILFLNFYGRIVNIDITLSYNSHYNYL